MSTLADLLAQALREQPATGVGRGSLADLSPKKSYYGYPVREPYQGEHTYFKSNPHVAGMATEDGMISFNPYAQNINRDAVGMNEAARLWMRENKFSPSFDVSPAQAAQFSGTPYEHNPSAMRETILGRILSNDPSAGVVTEHQRQLADWVHGHLKERK